MLIVGAVVMLTLFFGCEKEPIIMTPMRRLYTESTNLHKVTLDSITNFTSKFSSYVTKYPKSRSDEYFEPTLTNLRHAASLYGRTVIDTEDAITISSE